MLTIRLSIRAWYGADVRVMFSLKHDSAGVRLLLPRCKKVEDPNPYQAPSSISPVWRGALSEKDKT